MEYRIRYSKRGFYAEIGAYVDGDVMVEYKPGYYMPAFIVYESSRFDTIDEAKKYIAEKEAANGE